MGVGVVLASLSYRGLTTVSIKITKNINIISISNWIPRSSRGMTIKKQLRTLISSSYSCFCFYFRR
ncbi:MAG: hypothetical protein ACEY3D_03400 [Rickettsia sp.]|uniref:hypothetical protein n=1 Tax=Rickettsia sp. TaxID=789 RepID=UPI0039784C84